MIALTVRLRMHSKAVDRLLVATLYSNFVVPFFSLLSHFVNDELAWIRSKRDRTQEGHPLVSLLSWRGPSIFHVLIVHCAKSYTPFPDQQTIKHCVQFICFPLSLFQSIICLINEEKRMQNKVYGRVRLAVIV